MSRIKRLDTKILTVADVVSDFGWERTEVMFDDKFPFRTMVEVGARYDRGDYDHLFALRRQAETEVSSRGDDKVDPLTKKLQGYALCPHAERS